MEAFSGYPGTILDEFRTNTNSQYLLFYSEQCAKKVVRSLSARPYIPDNLVRFRFRRLAGKLRAHIRQGRAGSVSSLEGPQEPGLRHTEHRCVGGEATGHRIVKKVNIHIGSGTQHMLV